MLPHLHQDSDYFDVQPQVVRVEVLDNPNENTRFPHACHDVADPRNFMDGVRRQPLRIRHDIGRVIHLCASLCRA